MYLPFQLHCTISSPQLYERRDGRFQQLEPGAIGPLISGYRYLLVERSLGLFLQSLEIPRVRYEDAVIFDSENGKEIKTHVRIYVEQFFSSDQLLDLPMDGLRLLTLNDDFYFVSPMLKTCLENASFDFFSFTEGFSEIVGTRV